MSNRWFYEIDGQVVGPVEQTRLLLLADSGMLLPHHKVRREDHAGWFSAASIKGLFATATTPAGGVPTGTPVPPSIPAARGTPTAPAPPVVEEPPFGNWPTSGAAAAPAGVFDFFAESDAPPALPAK